MSDIIIRGMEMPKYGCDHCFLRTGNYCSRIDKDESVVEYARKSERHPDCPLFELSPHGRLIDVDEMERFMSNTVHGNIRDYPYSDTLWDLAFKWIDSRPTVIPESEDKDA